MRRLWVLATVALWSDVRAFADPAIAPDLDGVAAKLTFEPGRTSLTAAAKTALGPVLDSLQARRSARLVIVGHFSADASANQDVTARRRAEVVKWYLVDGGIETDRIDTRVSSAVVTGRIIELQLGGVPAQAPRVPTPPPRAITLEAALATPVTFAAGRTTLTAAAKTALAPVIALLHAQPTARLLIIGHDDSPAIAKRRAEVVKWHLVDEGIETDRLVTSASSTRQPGTWIELQLASSHPAPATAVEVVVPGTATSDASQMAELLGDEADTSKATRRTAGANLAAQIAAAHAQSVTIGGGEAGFRGGDTMHIETAGPAALDLDAPTRVTSTTKHAEDATARTTPGSEHADTPRTPAETIVRELRTRHTRRLSRCYRKALAADPELSGRVSLSFTVDRTGKVTAPYADSDDPDLDTCVRAQMTTWHFDPRPKPTTVTTTIVLRK